MSNKNPFNDFLTYEVQVNTPYIIEEHINPGNWIYLLSQLLVYLTESEY